MQQKTPAKPTYISNPFVLAHRASKRLFANNKWWAVVLLVLGVLNTFSSADSTTPSSNPGPAAVTGSSNPEVSLTLVVFLISLAALFMIVVLVFATYVTGILSYVTLQSEQGKKAALGEAFSATRQRFWRLLGALALAFVKIIGWTLLFVIPGIVAALRYSLLGYAVMDSPAEETSVKKSHERIKHLTKGRLWEVFGISFTGIIPFIGTLYSSAGGAGLYAQLKTYTDKNLEKPKIHWLNYLGLILFTTVLALAILVAAVAFTA